ncbi:hypothetical protein ZWY2020_037054 [Hordeum vulgare]|nr:hypothetical protein ZWY2020_037054 [Hordeum vulgare]
MIFADVEIKSRLKLVNREVNMAVPTAPKFLKWSQTAVTFDQSDHPTHVLTPGRQALVIDPVVEGVRLRKVLMDGGSGLNIMYADTLKGMGIPMSRLSESNMQFHGVVPGRKAKSLGQIALEVIFGSDKNFRKEKLTFEVVDFQNAYHAILGRPAYVSFMARPCYVYLKLKMPGPKGVITITGNRQRAEECLQEGSRIADQQMVVLELEEYKKTVDPADLMRSKKPASESAFQSAGETKKVSIHPTESQPPRRTSPPPWIPNRKPSSPNSSVRTGTSSHGSHLTCRVYLGSWLSTDCMWIPLLGPSESACAGPPRTKGRQSEKRWLSYLLPDSFARFTTPSGSPM